MSEIELLHSRPTQGIVLLCDRQGVIRQVLVNQLDLAVGHQVGQPLTTLVEPNSAVKIQNLLATLNLQPLALDWYVCIPAAETVIGLHVYAELVAEQIFIVAAPSQPDAELLLEALSQLDHEHQSILRQVSSDLLHQIRADRSTQLDVFDSFSRLNSELVNTQRELAKRNYELARLAEENAQLYQDAKAALQLRNEFIASITHDLRVPLTTIRGYGQILRSRVTRHNLAEAEKLTSPLDSIDAAVQRMIEQIDGLLDLARLQMGHSLAVKLSKLDLVLLIRDLLKTLAPLLARHRVQFVPAVPQLPGEWDRGYLERMVINIISNAVKYSPPGSLITINLGLDSAATPQRALLRICDHGVGIPPADLARIFSPFYRAANSDQTGAEGSGIGLASVRQIIELHGGTIRVTSEEDEGTCFTVGLPLIPPY